MLRAGRATYPNTSENERVPALWAVQKHGDEPKLPLAPNWQHDRLVRLRRIWPEDKAEAGLGGGKSHRPAGLVSAISLDSVSLKAQPRDNQDTSAKRSSFQSGGSPCRRLKKAIRRTRSRRQTRASRGPLYRPTGRRRATESRPAARSQEKRSDAGFGPSRPRYHDRP